MRSKRTTIAAILVAALFSSGQGGCEGEFPGGATPTGGVVGGTATSNVTITIQPNATGLGPAAFGANPLTVPSGTAVTWVNGDSVVHSIVASSNLFASDQINPSESFSRTFTELGSFGYFCGIHGPTSESGVILVTASANPSPSPTATTPLPTTPVPVPGPVLTPNPTATVGSPTGF